MKLVSNARDAWKWISMWCMGLSSSALMAWAALPEKLQDKVLEVAPEWVVFGGIGALLLMGMIGRVIDQTKQPAPAPEPDAQKELFDA